MKARQILNKQAQEDYYEKVFRDCAQDVMTQSLGCVFWTLAIQFGFGKRRLRKLADALHDTDLMMCKKNPLTGKCISPIELAKQVKEDYGIDLAKEFPVKIDLR